jgi:hypothetical protein
VKTVQAQAQAQTAQEQLAWAQVQLGTTASQQLQQEQQG